MTFEFIPELFGGKTGEEEIVDHIQRIYELVEEGRFDTKSPEFMYYCNMISNRDGFYILRRWRDENPDLTGLSINQARYCIFVSMNSNSIRNNSQMYVDGKCVFTEFRSEFEDELLFPCFESWFHLKNRDESNIERSLTKAINTSIRAINNCPDNYFVSFVFANTVRIAIDELSNFSEIEERVSNSRDGLLSMAINEIEIARQECPHRRFESERQAFIPLRAYYVVSAHLKVLNGELNKARMDLQSAERENPKTDYFSDSELERISNEVNLLELTSSVENLEQDIRKVEDELEGMVERFRSEMVQYLAFFAGIISIAVVSAQISLSTSSFESASRVILVFSGGLLVAFGGLSLMLPYLISGRDFWMRIIILLIIGGIIISAGILLPTISTIVPV